MNLPPSSFIRVPVAALEHLVGQLGLAAGLPDERSALLAQLLSANDARGVFSHGTVQMATYARLLREGTLNPRPALTLVKETPTSVLIDGDGGLGYFPSWDATEQVIAKAKAAGIAVGLTRNHGHFGAAGLYARRTLPHELLCFVTSGHQLHLLPGQDIAAAGGGSPMTFSAPAGEETSLLLDFGTMHDFYLGSAGREKVIEAAPGLLFRALGLAAVCQSWGGFLAGVPVDPTRAQRVWPGANQGSLIIAFRIDLFAEPADFKREMDEYIRAVRQLTPVAGFSQSHLPGGIEAVREEEFRTLGVPVSEGHRQRLEAVSAEFGVTLPW